MGYGFNNTFNIGFNSGFNNAFMPLSMPIMPFGGFYTSSQKTETEEEKQERLKKEEAQKASEELQKRMEMIKLRAENSEKLQQQITELAKYKTDLDTTINKAKKGKTDEEGNIRVKESWEDYNKLPAWKKGVRAASHLVQGTWKLATGFFGYETDEKTGESNWNWKKGLKNAAIAAGCIALTAVPVVGPVISTGLLATGVVCGAIGTGKGIVKAVNANTPEELDNAFQDMGAGLTIGVSSALGLRGLGKGLQASGAASGTSNAVRSTSNNALVQFGKDMTINAYRATVQGVADGRQAVGTTSFLRAYGANMKNTVPKLGKTKFDKSKAEITTNIDKRLSAIEQELNNPATASFTKALLEQEKALLNNQKTELLNTVSKDSWKGLKTNSKSHKHTSNLKENIKDMQSNGTVQINGNDFAMSNENLASLQGALKRSKELSKQIEQLSKLRTATMKKMAFYKKYASEVEAYTGKTRTNRIGRIYDASKITKADITWKNALLSPLKAIWNATMIPFKPWNYVQNSSTSTFYKIEETFVPEYEAGFLTSGMIADYMGMGEQTLKTKITTQDENGQNVEQEVAVTKEVLTQLEAQKQQIDEQITKVQDEFNKLYTA